jgi:hypothetical protein
MTSIGVKLYPVAFSLNAAQENGQVVLKSRFAPGDDDSVEKPPALPEKTEEGAFIQKSVLGVMDEIRIVAVGAVEIAT